MQSVEDSSWAHVSGWAQLSGRRRTVSCVVYGSDTDPIAYERLPELSDVLTECGYPWEIIISLAGDSALRRKVVSIWRDVPGFRHLELAAGVERRHTLVAGLSAARGDAIVALDGRWLASAGEMRSLMRRWESEGGVVCRLPDDAGAIRASGWHALNAAARTSRRAPIELLEFALIDRACLEGLI